MPRSSEKSTEPRRKRGEEEEEKGKEWGKKEGGGGQAQKGRTEVSVWEGTCGGQVNFLLPPQSPGPGKQSAPQAKSKLRVKNYPPHKGKEVLV